MKFKIMGHNLMFWERVNSKAKNRWSSGGQGFILPDELGEVETVRSSTT